MLDAPQVSQGLKWRYNADTGTYQKAGSAATKVVANTKRKCTDVTDDGDGAMTEPAVSVVHLFKLI